MVIKVSIRGNRLIWQYRDYLSGFVNEELNLWVPETMGLVS
jgi:hypothetical protein